MERTLTCACGCGEDVAAGRRYRQGHNVRGVLKYDDGLTPQQRYAQRLKLETFEAYGGAWCACCGEARIGFLVLDHVSGGGQLHRVLLAEEFGRRGAGCGHNLYLRLKRTGFPRGYQVLCANCNMAKGDGDRCPCPDWNVH